MSPKNFSASTENAKNYQVERNPADVRKVEIIVLLFMKAIRGSKTYCEEDDLFKNILVLNFLLEMMIELTQL